MNIGQAFPSKFLKAADLDGKEYTVTMREVLMEDVGMEGKPQVKPVLYFQGTEKGLILNKTNAEAISIVYTEETDHWIGQKVVIYPDVTMFNGQRTPCVRVRPVRQDGGSSLPAQSSPAVQQSEKTMSQPLGGTTTQSPAPQQPVDHGLDDSVPFAPLRELP